VNSNWVDFVAQHVGAWMHVDHGLGLYLYANANRRADCQGLVRRCGASLLRDRLCVSSGGWRSRTGTGQPWSTCIHAPTCCATKSTQLLFHCSKALACRAASMFCFSCDDVGVYVA